MGIKFSQLPIASSVASDDYIAVLDTSESVLKRTAINHASEGTAYGLGTTTAYGHTKIVDNLAQSTLTPGESLSSRQGNVIANDLGQVELTTTAAYAHSIGDFFILIGQFVTLIQAISVGDTITLGSNVEATNIGSVLGQLNSKLSNLISNNDSGFHNSIYRGKSLGSSYTAAQQAAVAAGTFDDMFIGDYWVIDGVTWRIAAFDYWLGYGSMACNTHHIVIVPDSNLLNADGLIICESDNLDSYRVFLNIKENLPIKLLIGVIYTPP